MLGSMFAGTDEDLGETEIFQGRKFKTYRGIWVQSPQWKKGSSDRYLRSNEANKLAFQKELKDVLLMNGAAADISK